METDQHFYLVVVFVILSKVFETHHNFDNFFSERQNKPHVNCHQVGFSGTKNSNFEWQQKREFGMWISDKKHRDHVGAIVNRVSAMLRFQLI